MDRDKVEVSLEGLSIAQAVTIEGLEGLPVPAGRCFQLLLLLEAVAADATVGSEERTNNSNWCMIIRSQKC